MLGVPIQTSLLLVRERGSLHGAMCTHLYCKLHCKLHILLNILLRTVLFSIPLSTAHFISLNLPVTLYAAHSFSVCPGLAACGAEYLFHGDSPYDLGDKTFQCGRRPDIVKLFLSWQHEGAAGFGRRVDAAFSAVARFVAMLKERAPEFEMVQEPHMLNVCFRYMPERIRRAAEGGKDVISEYVKKVHAVLIRRARVYVRKYDFLMTLFYAN